MSAHVQNPSNASEEQWLSAFFDTYRKTAFADEINGKIKTLALMMLDVKKANRKVIIAGNGGSAAIASHGAVDLVKTAGLRAVNFNESSLITCFANDYGYEQWVKKALEAYADDGDLVVLISSGGKSPNMLHAADYAVEKGLALVTLTGFSENNPLRSKGSLNFWANSSHYNIVENTHQLWFLTALDLLVELIRREK